MRHLFAKAFLSLCLLSFVGGGSGCKTVTERALEKAREKTPEPIEPAAMKVPVGKIHLVQPGGEFVLIRSSRFLDVEPGTVLTCFGNGGMETATLKVSPAKKGQFVTADILSGMPQVGDQTLMDHTAKRPSSGSENSATGLDNEIQVLE